VKFNSPLRHGNLPVARLAESRLDREATDCRQWPKFIQGGSMLDQAVPDFTIPATGGPAFQLSAQTGKNIVIYFYPKDSTPGCTTEGQQFRDLHTQFVAVDTLFWGFPATV
jgi:hypothetical protein